MNSEVPAVSVVMPSFNCNEYISQAIESVLCQTYNNFELIIVDNNSSDGTMETIESFNDDRIKLQSCQNHGVIAKSRNIGINSAKSDVVAFLDADDFWYPTKLEDCIPLLDDRDALVYHSELWFDDFGNSKNVNYGSGTRTLYKNLLNRGNVLSTSSVVTTKSLLNKVGGFCEDDRYITAEDYDLWMRLARDGASFVYVDRVLGAYRIHAKNTIKQEEVHEQAMISVLMDHFQFSDANKLKLRRRLSDLYAESGFTNARMGQTKISLKKFGQALRKFPLGLRGLALLVASIPHYFGFSKRSL